MEFSEQVLLALVAAVPPTLTAAAALVVSLRTNRAVEQVHQATNSMKDQLVAVTRSDALQEGHAAGVAEGKAKP